jgi:hypothetical protein
LGSSRPPVKVSFNLTIYYSFFSNFYIFKPYLFWAVLLEHLGSILQNPIDTKNEPKITNFVQFGLQHPNAFYDIFLLKFSLFAIA